MSAYGDAALTSPPLHGLAANEPGRQVLGIIAPGTHAGGMQQEQRGRGGRFGGGLRAWLRGRAGGLDGWAPSAAGAGVGPPREPQPARDRFGDFDFFGGGTGVGTGVEAARPSAALGNECTSTSAGGACVDAGGEDAFAPSYLQRRVVHVGGATAIGSGTDWRLTT